MKATHCEHCGYDGPPSKKDGVLYCGACNQRVGDDFLTTFLKLFALSKLAKPKKRRHHHHTVEKKGVPFMKTFLIWEAILAFVVFGIYFTTGRYQEDMGFFIGGLWLMAILGSGLGAFIAVAVKDCTTPIFDNEETVDCWEDHSDDE